MLSSFYSSVLYTVLFSACEAREGNQTLDHIHGARPAAPLTWSCVGGGPWCLVGPGRGSGDGGGSHRAH